MKPYRDDDGNIICPTFGCINNYGLESGKVVTFGYPTCVCMLDNPRTHDYGHDRWGCEDEEYIQI